MSDPHVSPAAGSRLGAPAVGSGVDPEAVERDRARRFILGAHVMIVDDQPANVLVLQRLLEAAGYTDLLPLTDPREVWPAFLQKRPDIILLDLQMPHLSGHDVLRGLRPHTRDDFIPVLVLTADVTSRAREESLSLGARDFLTKPFDHTEVLQRVGNLLETRFLHLELKDQNRSLETRVQERTKELDEARLEILRRLALAAEFRDDDTGQHTQRVGYTTALIAAELRLPSAEIELLRRAAPLHDVGKIGIPDAILLKPGRLTPEEFEIMKDHARIGGGILSGSDVPLLRLAETIALTHHERWDGKGYLNMVGEQIPLAGRIVAAADVFDALTHERPYKQAWNFEDSFSEITTQSGRQFDPVVVDAFFRIARRAYDAELDDPDQAPLRMRAE